MNRRSGFTLLELLMVVIIIAILASIALPQYIKATEKSRAAEALQIGGAIRAAEMRYKAQSAANVFATTVTDLDTDLPPTGLVNWNGPTITPAGADGTVWFDRKDGQFKGQIIGIDIDTGDMCGNFEPYFGAKAGPDCS